MAPIRWLARKPAAQKPPARIPYGISFDPPKAKRLLALTATNEHTREPLVTWAAGGQVGYDDTTRCLTSLSPLRFLTSAQLEQYDSLVHALIVLRQNMTDCIARERIEIIHNLDGGELAREVWVVHDRAGSRHSLKYWYEGVPEWVKSDFDEDDLFHRSYRTVLAHGDALPARVRDADGVIWKHVITYNNNPEVACPFQDSGLGDVAEFGVLPCPLCDGDDEHGFVVEEKAVEVVYTALVPNAKDILEAASRRLFVKPSFWEAFYEHDAWWIEHRCTGEQYSVHEWRAHPFADIELRFEPVTEGDET